ncbi:MAG TPA: tetratricopeptide repeat protein, partial [Gemmataceae bacterium]|nr:tetratricopeptide repeat protein [Gemmataceae bacterium]
IDINPRAAAFHSNLGLVYQALGQLDQARACFQKALSIQPDLADAHNALGFLLQNQGKIDEAWKHFQTAVNLRPDYPDALNNLGTVLFGKGKVDEAAAQFHQALRLRPDSVQAHNNLGLVFASKGKLEEAVTFYRQALVLDPTYVQAHNNLGNTLSEQGQLDAAAACYEQALRLNPHYAKASNNLGNVRKMQGRFSDALACYVQAMELDPDNVDTHVNRAYLWLVLGDWAKGWRELEWRRRNLDIPEPIKSCPRWDGSPLTPLSGERESEGRTILLHAEQGLGDTIQFIRYTALVKQRGARVVVQCQAPLTRLLSMAPGIDELVAEGSPLPAFDVQAPLLSLPGIFETRVDNVPAAVPYLHADDKLIEYWRQHLEPLRGLKIGIGWQGNPGYRADRQRSIPLAKFACLARMEGVQLISLQKGTGSDQLQAVASQFPIVDWSSSLDEAAGAFMDTAAIMKNLDLIITSDTVIAHLAGALGLPVWVALTAFPDWRWLLEREDCPWYPTMRLFRQRRFGDWDEVFDRMAQELSEMSGVRCPVSDVQHAPVTPDTGHRTADTKLLAQAWKHHDAGELDQAAYACRQLLELDSGHGEAWCLLGAICQAQGNHPEAETSYRRSLQVTPHNAAALSHLGVLLAQQGKLEEAAERLEDALRCQGADAEVLSNLGVVRAQQGQRQAALGHFHQALRLRPDYVQAHTNLGLALANDGKFDEAAQHYQEALRLDPSNAKAQTELGNALKGQGKLDNAVVQYREAVRLQPHSAESQRQLANALREQDNWDQAAVHYEEALRLDPANAETHNNLGNIRRRQRRQAEALDHFREALRLDPSYAEAHNNWGSLLREQGALEEAQAHYHEALRLKPELAEAYNNLANACRDKGNFAAALAAFDKALRLKPEFPEARWNRSLVRLLLGDFERGWPEYEWRWRPGHAWRQLPHPFWDGSPLNGKTILLWSEQGLGDTIQFIRYVTLVKERGGRVIVECQPALRHLLAGVKGIDNLISRGSPLPVFEVQAPLLSLPRIFNASLGHMPATVPYLHAEASLEEKWRVASGEWRAKTDSPPLLIGIAWQGNPTFDGDRQRSVPLANFAALAKVPGVRLISLQKGPGTEQLGSVAGAMPIIDLSRTLDEEHGAFMDTAAVMKNLDLVISSDTVIPHLAGALGVPVWVALAFVPDWRWMLRRDDSPWYPTMRLFRQQRLGDWDSVFVRIAEAVSSMLVKRGT